MNVRKTDEFSQIEYLLECHLEGIESFADKMESLIVNEAKQAKDVYQKRIEAEKENDFYSDILYNDLLNSINLYPQLIRKLIVQGLFSLIDNFLRRLAEQQFNNHGGIPSYINTSGNGISKARKFLVKSAKIDLTAVENEWKRIKKAQNVRDYLVHKESHSPKKKGEVIKICQAHENLDFDENNSEVIISSSEYIYETVKDVKVFCLKVLEELRNKSCVKPIH